MLLADATINCCIVDNVALK